MWWPVDCRRVCANEELKGGQDPQLRFQISRYLDDELTVIVMANIDERHADLMKIAGDIAAICLPDTKGANPIKDRQD